MKLIQRQCEQPSRHSSCNGWFVTFASVVEALSRGPGAKRTPGGAPIVLFHTPWERADDGWPIASRAFARAMALDGIDVRLQTWMSPQDPDPEVLAELGPIARKPAPGEWDLHVFSSMLTGADRMVPILRRLREQPGPQALYCVFERRYIEPELADALRALDGIWVQCEMNRQVLAEAGVESTLIPFPFFPDDPHLETKAPLSAKDFYWIGVVEPRKAPDNVVRAFMRAFHPGDGARLTMKCSAYKGPMDAPYLDLRYVVEDEIRVNRPSGWTAANWRERIQFLEGRLSRKEMEMLHVENQVYVSLSRGEGLELSAYAAKLSGNQLIATDSGGPKDFMGAGDVLIPTKGLIPANPYYPWGEGANYIDYDLDAVVEALRAAKGKQIVGSRVGDVFSADRVGKALGAWVEKTVEKGARR